MSRNFYVDNINDKDKLNEISILLNGMEEVSRIKIGKNGISFYCQQPESVDELLKEHYPDLVLKEEINSRKREYVAPKNKVEYIFMFTNLESQEDAREIEEVISHYSDYENVSLDFTNKLLKVTTNQKNVLVRLNRLVDKVNPNIDVEQWKKPFKSQDLFQEKYLKNMLIIAILLVAIALGLVTRNDPSLLTNIAWLVAIIIVNEKIIRRAYKDLKVKNFLSENLMINLACLFGWVYGAYIETLLVSLIFQGSERFQIYLINLTMEKINNLISPVKLGRKEIKDNESEMVALEDIDIGDRIIVMPGETIPLGGKVVSGTSEIDMFAINGSDVLEKVKAGSEVQSGSVNVTGPLTIEVLFTYNDSAMNKVLEIAMMAPVNSSRSNKIVEMICRVYTIFLVVVGIFCATIVPLVDLSNNFKYVYLGAILLTISGSFAYKQVSSFAVLSGVAKAFSKDIIIKENSGLDALNLCKTIIYDRFDGVEVSEEEMELFAKLSKLHRNLIIFNDGPVDLEDDQYQIKNNMSVKDKLIVMDKANASGPVAYIGDNSKDLALMQKAYVGISRGGIKDKKIIENSDIMLMNSDLDTVIETFKISKKQKNVTFENIFTGLFINVIVMLMAFAGIMPWWVALIIYLCEEIVVLLNTHRIIDMK